jgi:hypothetical protein
VVVRVPWRVMRGTEMVSGEGAGRRGTFGRSGRSDVPDAVLDADVDAG